MTADNVTNQLDAGTVRTALFLPETVPFSPQTAAVTTTSVHRLSIYQQVYAFYIFCKHDDKRQISINWIFLLQHTYH